MNLTPEFAKFLPAGQGIKYLKDDPKDFAAFRKWVFEDNRRGRLGMPRDWKETLECGQEAADMAEDKTNRIASIVHCRRS